MRKKVAKAIRKVLRERYPEGGKYRKYKSGQIIHTFNIVYRNMKRDWHKEV